MGSLLEFETARGELLLRAYFTGDTLSYVGCARSRTADQDIDFALLAPGRNTVFWGSP